MSTLNINVRNIYIETGHSYSNDNYKQELEEEWREIGNELNMLMYETQMKWIGHLDEDIDMDLDMEKPFENPDYGYFHRGKFYIYKEYVARAICQRFDESMAYVAEAYPLVEPVKPSPLPFSPFFMSVSDYHGALKPEEKKEPAPIDYKKFSPMRAYLKALARGDVGTFDDYLNNEKYPQFEFEDNTFIDEGLEVLRNIGEKVKNFYGQGEFKTDSELDLEKVKDVSMLMGLIDEPAKNIERAWNGAQKAAARTVKELRYVTEQDIQNEYGIDKPLSELTTEELNYLGNKILETKFVDYLKEEEKEPFKEEAKRIWKASGKIKNWRNILEGVVAAAAYLYFKKGFDKEKTLGNGIIIGGGFEVGGWKSDEMKDNHMIKLTFGYHNKEKNSHIKGSAQYEKITSEDTKDVTKKVNSNFIVGTDDPDSTAIKVDTDFTLDENNKIIDEKIEAMGIITKKNKDGSSLGGKVFYKDENGEVTKGAGANFTIPLNKNIKLESEYIQKEVINDRSELITSGGALDIKFRDMFDLNISGDYTQDRLSGDKGYSYKGVLKVSDGDKNLIISAGKEKKLSGDEKINFSSELFYYRLEDVDYYLIYEYSREMKNYQLAKEHFVGASVTYKFGAPLSSGASKKSLIRHRDRNKGGNND